MDTGSNLSMGPKAKVIEFYKELYGSCAVILYNGMELCGFTGPPTAVPITMTFGDPTTGTARVDVDANTLVIAANVQGYTHVGSIHLQSG